MVATEAVLLMFPLLIFLFLSYTLWRLWSNEHHVRVMAHRDMFMKQVGMMDGTISDIPFSEKFGGLGTGSPTAPKMPKLTPKVTETNLKKYTKFPLKVVEGRFKATSDPSNPQSAAGFDYSIGFHKKYFGGKMYIARWAYTGRAPWAWSSWPFFPKQTSSEADPIRDWYKKNYKKLMTSSRVNWLRVDDAPSS